MKLSQKGILISLMQSNAQEQAIFIAKTEVLIFTKALSFIPKLLNLVCIMTSWIILPLIFKGYNVIKEKEAIK
jgi:hypothetical protein